jgi:hypothetical protein
MNPRSERDYDNNNDDSNSRRAKAIATAIPMAWIIVAAALVSGPFFFIASSYPQAMAQQNNTMTSSELNGSTSAGGDNNSTTIGGSNVQSSACAEIQTGGTFDEGITVGGTSAADDYDADSEGEDNAVMTGTTDVTTTTAEAGGGNQPTADLRDFIEEACIALQVDDRQGALMYLDMALNALGGDSTQGSITNTPSGITNGTTTAKSDD